MKLALQLGYASPSRMLRELRPSELGLWAALYSIDPWGDQRADYRAALGTVILAESNRDQKRRSEPFTTADFMPYAPKPPEKERAKASQAKIPALLLQAEAGAKRRNAKK